MTSRDENKGFELMRSILNHLIEDHDVGTISVICQAIIDRNDCFSISGFNAMCALSHFGMRPTIGPTVGECRLHKPIPSDEPVCGKGGCES